MPKPHLRKFGKAKQISEQDSLPTLVAPGQNPEIIEIKEESWGSIISGWGVSILSFFGILLGLAFVLYSAFSATLLFITPINQTTVIVARGTFVGDIPEPGTLVYASTSEQSPETILGKIKTGFVKPENAGAYRILSNQNDQFTLGEGAFLLDGTPISGILTNPPTRDRILTDEYLSECVAGDCVEGSLTILPRSNIFGEIKQQ